MAIIKQQWPQGAGHWLAHIGDNLWDIGVHQVATTLRSGVQAPKATVGLGFWLACSSSGFTPRHWCLQSSHRGLKCWYMQSRTSLYLTCTGLVRRLVREWQP